MNDEYREGSSQNESSSRTAGSGTATAEPVDRRWFVEALRAQGFLVEPPPVDPEPGWQDDARPDVPAPVDAPESRSPIDAQDVVVPAGEAEPVDDLALAEAEAVLETAPLTTQVTPQAEPWDLPPATLAWPTVDPVRPDPVPWPVLGTPPATLAPAASVTATEQTVAPPGRKAVAPTTLPADVPPVPTAALAARLARTSGSGTSPAPVEATATVTDAPSAIDARAAVTTATDDPWARPPLWAAVVSERVGAAAPSDAAPTAVTPLDDLPPPAASVSVVDEPTTVAPVAPVALAVEPVVADEPGAGPSTAAAAAAIMASPDVPAAPPEVKAAGPAEDQSPAPPPTVELAETTALPAEPTTASLGTPTAGVAAIAPAAAQTIGTTVDNGESELWGLVGDPAQPSTSTVAAPATKSSSRATALLTIFVAIVVVALVLGFIYLFTSLL